MIENFNRLNLILTAMKNSFKSIEGMLALEAWMIQAFKLEDKILEGDIVLKDRVVGDVSFTQLN